MERFDRMLKDMAEQEECIVPKGFDRRLQETLDGLPSRKKERRLGVVKGVLIAAAACGALLGTAFAASPGLREMLAEALGSFAPYAQEQDSEVYTWNGFEFKVMSALADENTLRAFVQVTDLEGRDRLDYRSDAFKESPWIEVAGVHSNNLVTGGNGASTFDRYDAATQTLVSVVTIWGYLSEDLSGAVLRVDTVKNMLDDPWNAAVQIPLDVEIMPSKTVLRNIEASGLQVDEVRISALSLTVDREKTSEYFEGGDLNTTKMSVEMKDGTIIGTEYDHSNGNGSYIDSDTGREHEMMIWNFADPVEPDQIAGVYIGEDYYPIK